MTAANLGVSARTFAALGGFDERFPYAGYEDQEFSYRAREGGHRFIYDPAIRLEHNDERVTLEQFARRYERGAVTAVYLAAMHPEAYATSPLVLENAPITKYDPPTAPGQEAAQARLFRRGRRLVAARGDRATRAPRAAVIRAATALLDDNRRLHLPRYSRWPQTDAGAAGRRPLPR